MNKKAAIQLFRHGVSSFILEHLGLPTTGPPVAAARRNESPEFAIWQDDVPELEQSLR